MCGTTHDHALASGPSCAYTGLKIGNPIAMRMGGGMNKGLLDELVRAAGPKQPPPEALEALAMLVERRARPAAESRTTQRSVYKLDYTWLDIEDAARTLRAQQKWWLAALRKEKRDKSSALNQWIDQALWYYVVNTLGTRAFEGNHADRVRLMEELVSWVHAEVRKRRSDGSYQRVEVEDVTQTVCLKVWKSFAQYKGQAPFSSWVRKIIGHAMTDAIRKADLVSVSEKTRDNGTDAARLKRSYNQVVSIDAPMMGHDGDGSGASILDGIDDPKALPLLDRADNLDLIAKIEAFLDQQENQQHCEMFRLRVFEGLSTKAIAERLKTTVSTVDMAVHRLRHKLREMPEVRTWLR